MSLILITSLEKEIERLIHALRAVEFRVSMEEGEVKMLKGKVEELERR